MNYHGENLTFAFIGAIVISCSVAFFTIWRLFYKVLAESRQSEKEEHTLYVFFKGANVVLHQYYSQHSNEKDGPAATTEADH